jgi:hypothetical protein
VELKLKIKVGVYHQIDMMVLVGVLEKSVLGLKVDVREIAITQDYVKTQSIIVITISVMVKIEKGVNLVLNKKESVNLTANIVMLNLVVIDVLEGVEQPYMVVAREQIKVKKMMKVLIVSSGDDVVMLLSHNQSLYLFLNNI